MQLLSCRGNFSGLYLKQIKINFTSTRAYVVGHSNVSRGDTGVEVVVPPAGVPYELSQETCDVSHGRDV